MSRTGDPPVRPAPGHAERLGLRATVLFRLPAACRAAGKRDTGRYHRY